MTIRFGEGNESFLKSAAISPSRLCAPLHRLRLDQAAIILKSMRGSDRSAMPGVFASSRMETKRNV